MSQHLPLISITENDFETGLETQLAISFGAADDLADCLIPRVTFATEQKACDVQLR